jgi:hypothetical protein
MKTNGPLRKERGCPAFQEEATESGPLLLVRYVVRRVADPLFLN